MKHRTLRVKLGFTNELVSAAGAADADLPLTTGNPDSLPAMGATEVSVIPVLQSFPKVQPLLIFLLPEVNVLREHSIEGKNHYTGVQEAEEPIEESASQENIQQIVQQAQSQNQEDQSQIKLIGAIATIHEASKHSNHRLLKE